MSMSTFYFLMSKDGSRVERVSLSTSADEAHRYFTTGWATVKGEIYAVRMSDGAAAIVRDLVDAGKHEVANRHAKMYAHSFTKVGDVT